MEELTINNSIVNEVTTAQGAAVAEMESTAAERLEGQPAEKRLNIDSGGYRNVRINKRGIFQ